MAKKTNNQMARQQNPSDSQRKMQMEIAATSTTTIHQGPLPSPEMLYQYNQILPGAAERIITMAEDQSKHRQDLERTVIKARARDSLYGIISAAILCITTILCGTFTVLNGHEVSGAFLGTAGLAGLAGVFVYGTRENRKERESKLKNLEN